MKCSPTYPTAVVGPNCHFFCPSPVSVAVGKINVGPAARSQWPTNAGPGDTANARTVSPTPVRFLEFNGLRDLPDPVPVADLLARGIFPVPLDRNAEVLSPETSIVTNGWLRPRLWSGRPVLPVEWQDGRWVALGRKPKDADVAE